MYVYTQSNSQDSEEDHITTNSMTEANNISKIKMKHCQSLKQTLNITQSQETVSNLKQQLIKQSKDKISRKKITQSKIFKKEDTAQRFHNQNNSLRVKIKAQKTFTHRDLHIIR